MAPVRTSARTVVGLDIEPGFVTAAQVRVDGAVTVERAAGATLPPGVLRDGEVADVEALADALRELFRTHKLGKRVRLGVATQRIVVRTIDLPPLDDAKQIDAAVRFQAQDHIPMPLEQAVLSHQALGKIDTPDGPRTRVVLVAARRDVVERFHAAARQAGLRPVGIDLSAFAMIRALHDGTPGVTLYVSVGGMTNLALADGTTCLFTRVVPGGVEALAAALAERRGLTLEHARQWLAHVGLTTPLEQLDGDAEIVEEARSVLLEGVRRIADEVRNSLDFHRAQAGALAAQQAIVTGPAIAIPGFCEHLGEATGLPVRAGDVAEARDGGHGGIPASRLAIAAGLAVEDAPRRTPAAPAPAPEFEPTPAPEFEPTPAPEPETEVLPEAGA
ncbi:MAG: type IV pilus assembly protein PilM [Actinobacteria bacterium]|nr:type IV pilus assembly protein PilM [Actinomycetota bacterium]